MADAEDDARQGKSPNAADKQLVAALHAWHDAGGSRRDADLDGKIDDPGAAILDAAWKGITDAGLCDRLGTSLCKQLEGRTSRFDQPPGGQYSGWHQYMGKDLRRCWPEGSGTYHLRYCGDGASRPARRSCGRRSTRRASAWPATRARIRPRGASRPTTITFSPLPLITIQYTNKPTGIHQVMQFGP